MSTAPIAHPHLGASHVIVAARQVRRLMQAVEIEEIQPGDAFAVPEHVDLTLREARVLVLEALLIMETLGWSTGDDGLGVGEARA